MVENRGSDYLVVTFESSTEVILMESMRPISLTPVRQIGTTSMAGILDTVRNTVLLWTLKLEEINLVDEKSIFKEGDQKRAEKEYMISVAPIYSTQRPSFENQSAEAMVKGSWKWLYRAVNTDGDTVEFLLSAKRDKKAVRQCGTPRVINIDKSGANKAGIDALNDTCGLSIEVRQVKYLNNIIEQSHRLIRRMTQPMMGFGNF